MLSVAVGVVTVVVLELGDVQEGEAPVDGCAGRRTFCTILSLSAEKLYLVSFFHERPYHYTIIIGVVQYK